MRRRFKKSKKKLYIFSTLCILLVLILLVFFLKFNIFKINNLEVLGRNLDCVNKEQIKESIGIYGKSFLNVDTESITKKLKEKFYCIKSINYSKKIPDTIKIDISTRNPLYQIKKLKEIESSASSLFEIFATPSAITSEEIYLVDDEGVIFAKTDNAGNLPSIFVFNANLYLGGKISNNYSENILKILNEIQIFNLDISISMINMDNLYLFSYPRIIFKLNSDMRAQIASLQLILEKSKIDSSKVEFIDLRFDKPIIKIAPKKNG